MNWLEVCKVAAGAVVCVVVAVYILVRVFEHVIGRIDLD